MHKRFIIKFKSCIDMITLFPTIPAFCQFAMVKCYQGWWSYDGDYTEMMAMMMMMMMMMASRTMIMLRRCFAATLNYLGRRLLQRKWGNGEVCAQTTLIAATCLSLEAFEHYHHHHHHHRPNHPLALLFTFCNVIDSDLFSARKTING